MKIYFAAHSTSKDNENEIASGWKDVELSELGIKQSKELGERFKSIKIDLICCSDLKRAVDTVKIAFGDPSAGSGQAKIPVIADKRLRELNYGDLNGAPSKIVSAMKDEAIKKPFPNGESYEQAMLRIHDFYSELKVPTPTSRVSRILDKIGKKYSKMTILVVGHRATQYGLDTLTGKTIEECLNKPFKWQPYWEYNI